MYAVYSNKNGVRDLGLAYHKYSFVKHNYHMYIDKIRGIMHQWCKLVTYQPSKLGQRDRRPSGAPIWCHSSAVRILPCHGRDTGSIPVGTAKSRHALGYLKCGSDKAERRLTIWTDGSIQSCSQVVRHGTSWNSLKVKYPSLEECLYWIKRYQCKTGFRDHDSRIVGSIPTTTAIYQTLTAIFEAPLTEFLFMLKISGVQ